MSGRTNNNNNNSGSARANRRETKGSYNDSNNNNNRNSTNTNSNNQPQSLYDRRKQQQQQQQKQKQQSHQQPQPQQQQSQPQQQQSRPQEYRDRSEQRYDRDRSGQRYDRDRSNQRGGVQFPDSSMGGFRDGYGLPNNLGAVRFTPGMSTRELPPIETRSDPNKIFTGRCRLFVGNLPHNTSEEQVRALFEPFGKIGELYLGAKSAFAFVVMDTRQNAEAARDKLDCSMFEGRSLRVRLAAHANAIRVKHLSPVVTNELLAYAFRYFGEIERAVVVVDDKGKSIGEGIVEYSKKASAIMAVKKCQNECFMLTSSPMPVVVEPYLQHDDEEGLPERSANKNSIEYKEQRDKGPRFAEPGSFEHSFGLRWKELYSVEKQKHERLEQEIEDGRKTLQNQIEYSRLEHTTIELQNQLKQLQDNRMKLQQMKEQTTDSHQRDELRRQQDLMIRQREEEILRRQQVNETSYLNQQPFMQDMMGATTDAGLMSDQTGLLQDTETGTFGSSVMDQAPRTFADVAMMGMNQSFMQQPQQMPGPMGMAPMNQQAMFTGYIPPPTLQTDSLGNSFGSYQQATTFTIPTTEQQQQQQQQVQQQQAPGEVGPNTRQQKRNRAFGNQQQGNNINVLTRSKRGRF